MQVPLRRNHKYRVELVVVWGRGFFPIIWGVAAGVPGLPV